VIRRYLIALLAHLGKNNWDLSVVFCTDSDIRELNRQFRGKDEATDVLSFPLGESVEEDGERRYLPGDIVISLDTLAANAAYFNVDQNEELRRLLIHGVLHLDGMDHAGTSLSEPMLRIQETILASLGPLASMPKLP
jgi:probable rRNA maturation factor